MGNFYLDIETTGLDYEKDKIITIQYQEIDRKTCKPVGELRILKEWESSEREIIQKFIGETKVNDPYVFNFVPVGFNLNFEHNFLKRRSEINLLPMIDILNHPFVDFKGIAVLMNKGEFKNCGLDKLTGKKSNGSKIPLLYKEKMYSQIVEYIEMEAKEFRVFAEWCQAKMPFLLEEFQKDLGIHKTKMNDDSQSDI